jgi:hypothetical protein
MGDVTLKKPPGNQAISQSMQPYNGTGSSAGADLIFLPYSWDQNGHEGNRIKQGATATCYNKNFMWSLQTQRLPLFLQMRRDWLQASQQLYCKPKDPLEHIAESSREKES